MSQVMFEQPVVELTICSLKSDADIHNVSTAAGKVWQEISKTAKSLSIPGMKSPSWGQDAENPKTLLGFGSWDRIGTHMAAGQKEEHQLLAKLWMSIVDGMPEAYHAGVDTSFYEDLVKKRATLDIINLAFDPEADVEINGAKDKLQRFAEAIKPDTIGFYGSSWGWSLEMGERQKGWAIISGWRDIQSCVASRESTTIAELRNLSGLLSIHSYVVSLQPFQDQVEA